MKIIGNKSTVFERLFSRIQKNSKDKTNHKSTSKQIEETKILVKNHASDPSTYSEWENTVRRKLKESDIIFEEKSRKFPLSADKNDDYEYTPEFILKNYLYGNKRILIEVHKTITKEDRVKYGLFMEGYGGQYHLVLIVKTEHLQKWNNFNQNTKTIFNDICTIEDFDHYIKYIKKYEVKNTESSQHTSCPNCQIKASGTAQIHKLFGYRKMGNGAVITQSLCRKCRGEHQKMRAGKTNEYYSRKNVPSKPKT